MCVHAGGLFHVRMQVVCFSILPVEQEKAHESREKRFYFGSCNLFILVFGDLGFQYK